MIKEFVEARNVSEAVELLKDPGARIMAGGTTFFEFFERGLLSDVETIVDLEEAGLNYVAEGSEYYRVGSCATIEELGKMKIFDEPEHLALGEASRAVKPVQIRNVATIGGNLCSALPVYDMPIALCALDASVIVAGPDRERAVPANEFIKGYLSNDLSGGEMVKEIQIPRHSEGVGSSFLKLGRTNFDYGIVTVATSVRVDANGICKSASIILGNYDEKPFRAAEFEKALVGHEVTEATIKKGANTLNETSPIPSLHASAEYKKKLAMELAAQSLLTSSRRGIQSQ